MGRMSTHRRVGDWTVRKLIQTVITSILGDLNRFNRSTLLGHNESRIVASFNLHWLSRRHPARGCIEVHIQISSFADDTVVGFFNR
uniref:Uncharacterized protein n=1 Tax=Salix viminalis TaxID=40686 RepID=A0A6N2KJS1_SALVM